jgi:putative FmdB family regulatory protein
MPFYVYKCQNCGTITEKLQKMDAPAPVGCEACGLQEPLQKQVTASGFQLKGNGYYVTDFKNN